MASILGHRKIHPLRRGNHVGIRKNCQNSVFFVRTEKYRVRKTVWLAASQTNSRERVLEDSLPLWLLSPQTTPPAACEKLLLLLLLLKGKAKGL